MAANRVKPSSDFDRWVKVNGKVLFVIGHAFTTNVDLGEDGIHTIMIYGYDNAGNKTLTARTVTVDTTRPEPFTVTAEPPDWTNNVQPVITFHTTDTLSGIDRYELSLNNGTATEIISPYTLPPLADGQHTLAVSAYDTAGNSRTAAT